MKTRAEKELIKQLKRDHKNWQNDYRTEFEMTPAKSLAVKESQVPQKPRILTGILPEEHILEDDHPVYGDFYYVVDDNGGNVIRSDVFGTILTLKADLRKLGYKAENIYSCKMVLRNLF